MSIYKYRAVDFFYFLFFKSYIGHMLDKKIITEHFMGLLYHVIEN